MKKAVITFIATACIFMGCSSPYEKAQAHYEQGKNDLAKQWLQKVKKGDSDYQSAEDLLMRIENEEMKKQAKEDSISVARVKRNAELDSIRKFDALKAEKEDLINGIKTTLFILENFESAQYRNGMGDLRLELNYFRTHWEQINKANESQDSTALFYAKKAKAKIEKIQEKEFPIMRKQYAKHMNTSMWEHDIKVITRGAGSRTIRHIGGFFAANKNVKDYMLGQSETITMLRFTREEYLWHELDDEYTYYSMKPDPDKAPVK
jgi:hypothetical protein